MNLKTIKRLMILGLIAVLITVIPMKVQAQTIIKIGEAELVIQSPIKVKKTDTLTKTFIPEKTPVQGQRYKFRPRFYSNVYIGGSMTIPMDRNNYLPVHYGEVYNIEAGVKNVYKLSRFYGIGATIGYSHYNYRLTDSPFTGVIDITATEIKKEYFRTDNMNVGLFNRFYITGTKWSWNSLGIDAGAYVDFAFSRRYKVLGYVGDTAIKEKFKNELIFNPFQAGLFGAIVIGDWSIFGKYRLTNQFSPDGNLKETPRLNIGVLWSL
jgi:hypothetical protein